MRSSPPLKHVAAFLAATVAALFVRAWLQIRLLDAGYDPLQAADLSYLAVPPVLALLLLPVIRKDWEYIRAGFRLSDLSVGIVMCATGIGILMRVVWHGFAVARAAPGAGPGDPAGADKLIVRYDCPAAHLVLVSLAVTSILIPIVEELTHRGYVQSYCSRLGPVGAVAVSTALFVVFHAQSSWLFAAFGGIVLGTCFWLTSSLWAPVIVHATANLLPQLTLRCLDIRPGLGETPARPNGLIASLVAVLAGICLIALLVALGRRRGLTAPASRHSKRVGDSLDDV